MTQSEMWMLMIPALCAVVPWAFSMHAKVAVIASSVESLPKVVDEIREALAEHEARLNDHAKEIETLKVQTRSGG